MADLSRTPWNEITRSAKPEDRIAKHFKLYELTRSETADRDGIHNGFRSVKELRNAVNLSRKVLQRMRNEFGSFVPNSVYRSQELERALKKKRSNWVSTSQHTKGQACDIEIPGMKTIDLAQWVVDKLEFDQVICECYNKAKGPNSGWVHVSLLPPGGRNRGEVLSYVWDMTSGKYVYVKGLKESAK